MEKLWEDLHQVRYILTLWCHNQAAKEYCKDSGKFHQKTKHIESRYFYIINNIVGKNCLKVNKIAGTDNPADIFTKHLPYESLRKHLDLRGIRTLNSRKT